MHAVEVLLVPPTPGRIWPQRRVHVHGARPAVARLTGERAHHEHKWLQADGSCVADAGWGCAQALCRTRHHRRYAAPGAIRGGPTAGAHRVVEDGCLEMALTLWSARRGWRPPGSGDRRIGHEQRPLKALFAGEPAQRRLLVRERSVVQPFEPRPLLGEGAALGIFVANHRRDIWFQEMGRGGW